MSLVFGFHSRLRVGPLASRLSAVDSRAFQTLSALTTSTRGHDDDDTNGKSAVAVSSSSSAVRRRRAARPIPTAATYQFSSLFRAVEKSSSSLLQFSPRVTRPIVSQPARSMAGAPEKIEQFRDGKPTLEYAKTLPKTFATMTNEQVLHFAELSVPEACRECVVRDIMSVDQVEYDEAMTVFEQIRKTNREGMFFAALPFYSGFGAAVIGCGASFPLVFDRTLVEWFNEAFVTADMPPEQDLETILEVGSVAWGWMEPLLGTLSFGLLCLQFARAQLHNLGIRPYFSWQQERRAAYLVQMYPQYDASFLTNYSKCDHLARPHKMED